MKLHEAIVKLLSQINRPMIANDIAEELNKSNLYSKKDKSAIRANQIIARVDDHPDLFIIDRLAYPLQIQLKNEKSKLASLRKINTIPRTAESPKDKIDLKASFEPISNIKTRILILGSMPGDNSILIKEYYAHPRNRFWKIVAAITNTSLPISYKEKIDLLHRNLIGIWDVVHKANRNGSLDFKIKNEEPNDLESFIMNHKELKVICFNGTKSQKLYDKYFVRKSNIKYLLLQSSSPANCKITFDDIKSIWKEILI